VDRVLAKLSANFPEMDATAFAEAMWLAALRHSAGLADSPQPDSQQPDIDKPSAADTAGTRLKIPPQLSPGLSKELYDVWENSSGAGNARLQRVHASRALPHSLEMTRALRPFKRPWRTGFTAELDIEATVRAYAETSLLTPIFRRAAERWFDVVVVVDDSSSMAAWEPVAAEFAELLVGLGAFRTVTKLRLRVRAQSVELTDGRGRGSTVKLISSPSARRLVLVVSDCSADGWRYPPVWKALCELSASTPTALVNPLPSRLWRRGGLSLPATLATQSGVGKANTSLTYQATALRQLRPESEQDMEAPNEPPARMIALPAVGLTPGSLHRWAMTIMRSSPQGCEVVLMSSATSPAQDDDPSAAAVSGAEIVETFEHIASADAERLALLCAPYARVSLAVLGIIRQLLVPDAAVADMAELVAAGLMTAHRDGSGAYLAFRPGVREILMHRLREYDVWRVYEALTGYVAQYGDRPPYFLAAAHDPRAVVEIPEGMRPFAKAAIEALRVLPWLEIPADPESAAIEREPDRVGREPVGSISTAATGSAGRTGPLVRAQSMQHSLDLIFSREHDTASLLAQLDRVAGELFDLAIDWDRVDVAMAERVRYQEHRLRELRHRVETLGEDKVDETFRIMELIREALRDVRHGALGVDPTA
jgi:hypothetical protein